MTFATTLPRQLPSPLASHANLRAKRGVDIGGPIQRLAVEKSNHGWMGGFQDYTVRSHEGWMGDGRSSFVLPVAHHDQVAGAPSRSRVLASNDLCPYGALCYTDRRAISFQGHPEFAPDYAKMLIDRCQQRCSQRLSRSTTGRGDAHRASDDSVRRVLMFVADAHHPPAESAFQVRAHSRNNSCSIDTGV
jgi:hypothetical protein